MKKIGTAIAALGVATVALLTVPVTGSAPASQAQAADCHTSLVCGRIHNGSSRTLSLIHNWGGPVTKFLAPGDRSERYYSDTDGFHVPAGQTRALWKVDNGTWYYYGRKSGSVKVSDNIGPASVSYWVVKN